MTAQSKDGRNLEIRRMNADDIPRAMEIAAEAEHAPRYSSAAWFGILSREASLSRIALVAAGPDGALRGFAVASLLPPHAELESIAVAAESLRQGIGRLLLRALIGKLLDAGIEELWLEVRASNAPAIALYRAAGFRETGRRPAYYANPVEDALLMSLNFSAALIRSLKAIMRSDP